MSKPFFIYVVLFLLSFNYIDAQEGWMNKCNSSKVVGNYVFTFHAELNIDDKNRYIEKSLNSINECLDLIGEKSFIDSIRVEFLNDRSEMKKYLGWPASGMAYPDRKTMFCIVAEKTPIKHEWMHMVSMLKWGTPDRTLTWLNEGLATYADKCSIYSNEKIYQYLIQKEKLIKIDELINDFYNQNDVIAYFQSAYLVEYLLSHYGVYKFKLLWQSDINQFNEIYEQPLKKVIKEIEVNLIKRSPVINDFNWEEFEKGCY